MTAHPHTDQVLDEYDRPVPGAEIYVTDTLTLGNANLTIDGTVPLAQPIIADEFGFYTYWANDGIYREDVYFAGKLRYKGLAYVGVPPQIKGDPGGNILSIGLFDAADTLTIPAGTDVVRTSGFNALGRGAAYYQRDAAVNSAYVAANPRTSFISFNGIGYKLSLDQRLSVTMFGAVGDDTTDDGPAIAAMESWLLANGVSGFGYSAKSLGEARLPAGVSNLASNPVDLYGTQLFGGVTGGLVTGGGSVLKFSSNTTGLRVQNAKSSGDSGYNASLGLPSATGSIVHNLYLQGANTGTDDSHPGIRVRAPCIVRDMLIDGFAGSGVRANANLAATDGTYADASLTQVYRVCAQNCDSGFYLQGADANACLLVSCSAVANRAYGFRFDQFLNATALACHAAGNALGGYHSSGDSNPTLLLGCYEEGGQPAPTFSPKTLRVGGVWPNGGTGGGIIQAENNRVTTNDLQVQGLLFVDSDASITGALTITSLGIAGTFSLTTDGTITSFAPTFNLAAAGAVIKIAGTAVVGPQRGSIGIAAHAAGATPTQAEYDDLVDKFNALVSGLSTSGGGHGLFA